MQEISTVPVPEPDPLEQTTNTLRSELGGLFQVTNVTSRTHGQVIIFSGRLLVKADISYEEIKRRFQAHGYTPALRHEKGEDIILAMEGLVDQPKTGNPLVNILLLVATVLTTLSFGAILATDRSLFEAISTGSLIVVVQAMLAGLPFAITLLGILGVHELGHYVAARLHGVKATLPYFIPMPFGVGTLGAFISLKSPMQDRKVLFDIGLAGPYAGLFVAVPLMLLGLLLSSTNFVTYSIPNRTLDTLGTSVLIEFFLRVFTSIPPEHTLLMDPVFFAAWLGFYLTGINLLPVGQLDGGHGAYALLGRPAHAVALITFLLLIIAGALNYGQNWIWLIWAFFIMLGGLRHPPPMNDISDVGPVRKAVGIITIALFFLIFIPVPFR